MNEVFSNSASVKAIQASIDNFTGLIGDSASSVVSDTSGSLMTSLDTQIESVMSAIQARVTSMNDYCDSIASVFDQVDKDLAAQLEVTPIKTNVDNSKIKDTTAYQEAKKY